MTRWIVLYAKGARIGSVEHTEANLAYLNARLILSPIATEELAQYFAVLGIRRRSHRR